MALSAKRAAEAIPLGVIILVSVAAGAGFLVCPPVSIPWLAVTTAGLLVGVRRMLSGGLTTDVRDHGGQIPPLVRWFDTVLMALVRPLHLERSGFFVLQRSQARRWFARHVGTWALLAVLSPLAPWVLFHLGCPWPVALALVSFMLCFGWWLAGVFSSFDSLAAMMSEQTLQILRLAPVDPARDSIGMVAGRVYPLLMVWLPGLPVWLYYALGTGVPALPVLAMPWLFLVVCMAGAVGGVRSACTNIEYGLKAESRFLVTLDTPSCACLWLWTLLPGFITLAMGGWPQDIFLDIPYAIAVPGTHVGLAWGLGIALQGLIIWLGCRYDHRQAVRQLDAVLSRQLQ
jgi:hypothetical protein